jgi:hypothetical protein
VKVVEALVSRPCERQAVGTTSSPKAQEPPFDSGSFVLDVSFSIRPEARLS